MDDFSYVTLDAYKAENKIAQTTDDAINVRRLEAATKSVEAHIRRTLRTYLATMYFTAQSARELSLDADQRGLGLLAVTTLKTDGDEDRTYGTTWAITDFDLWPFNAAANERPYFEVHRTPRGDNNFPSVRRGVEIVGKWGYFEDLVRNASLMAEALDATETAIDVDSGADFEVLQTILVDSEQMYIESITSNTLTVVRGVNGTTAATHADDAVVDVYRYPKDVVEGTLMHATRMRTRGVTGYSDEGGYTGSGTTRPWVGMDFDVQELLAPFRVW
jgi:hypothetical protein